MAKRVLGAISFITGLAILVWFAYNLVWPTHEFKRSFRSLAQLVVPLAMVRYGWRWLRDTGPGIETVQIDPMCPELVASVEKAKKTMPAFLSAVSQHVDNAYVKFSIVTDTGVTEHIWAYVHHYGDGVFNVSLANSPYTQKGQTQTRRDVRESEVEDWQIMTSDDRIKGAYSLRALFEHLERNGARLNATMRKQRAQFLDAIDEPGADQHASPGFRTSADA